MNQSALNRTLQRPLSEGSIYNALFSTSNCTPTPLGDGDTEFTINQMKQQVLKWADELNTKKVQQLFDKPTLLATVTNLHHFEFNHYQYNADGWDQNLRSPKCAWASRFVGIDCKSYAITASCLLLKLNIKHYLRRIKQPLHKYPNEYTHVYVNVPFDQVNGDLTKGYYTIDGTLPTMQEPLNTNPHDIFMSTKIPHYALNGSGVSDGTNTIDLGGSGTTDTSGDAWGDVWGIVSDSATGDDGNGGWLSDINLGDTFSSIGGWFGGSGAACSYGSVQLEADLTGLNAAMQTSIKTALSPDLTISEKEIILTDAYFIITEYVLMVQANNFAEACTHPATGLLVDGVINNYLPAVYSALQQNLAASGITMRISDIQKNGINTKKISLNMGIVSGSTTSTGVVTTTGTTSPTGTTTATNSNQQQIDAGSGKPKTSGMGAMGYILLATAAGLSVNEYMKSQKKSKKNDKTTPKKETK